MPSHVWYAAYGSNMHAVRLRYYLAGGTPPGANRTYPGCRDPRPPLRTVPVMMPGGIYFASESVAWTGGMAFYDPDLPGAVAARAYLVTAEQFADIATQEMHRTPPGVGPDSISEAVTHGGVRLGPGRYETLVCPGFHDDRPLLTFTAPWRASDVEWNRPAATYLGMLAGGLRESHGWDTERITAYLGALPGVDGTWTTAEVTALVADAIHRYDR